MSVTYKAKHLQHKTCTKCGVTKVIYAFRLCDVYGYFVRKSQCLGCERKYKREKESEKYNATLDKSKWRLANKIWRRKNRFKHLAHKAVQRAKDSHRLIQQVCVVCGSKDTQAHHEDYTKPLDVIWLCREHHFERHYGCHI